MDLLGPTHRGRRGHRSGRMPCVSQSVPHRIAEELGVRERQVQRGRRPARRRRDRAVHRPLPQGGHRHARRRPAAHARGAAALPARAGGAARGDPGVDPRRRASSTTRSRRRSSPPTPRPGWRTSTCRTSPSGGPRRRSPARPASSRSPTCCSATRRTTRRPTAAAFVDAEKGVADAAAALDGARAILVERFAEDADLIGDAARADVDARAGWSPRCATGKEEAGAKFADYFDFAEPFTKLPSHRILALFRGEKEEVLDLTLEPEEAARRADAATVTRPRSPAGSASPTRAGPATAGCSTPCAGPGAPGSSSTSASTCGCGCGRRPRTRRSGCSPPTCATCCSPRPAGTRATMGLDPGFRTGVKVAVVDATGKVRGHRHDLPARAARTSGTQSLATLGRLAKAARRRPDRDRQRHRLARDRQARRRPDQAGTRS